MLRGLDSGMISPADVLGDGDVAINETNEPGQLF